MARKNPKDKLLPGRPVKEWSAADCAQFKQLCQMQCTEQEVCAVMGVSDKTLVALINEHMYDEVRPGGDKEESPLTFSEAKNVFGAHGIMSVRRNLFKLSSKGNVAATIFLAKNLLGMSDNPNAQAAEQPVVIVNDYRG